MSSTRETAALGETTLSTDNATSAMKCDLADSQHTQTVLSNIKALSDRAKDLIDKHTTHKCCSCDPSDSQSECDKEYYTLLTEFKTLNDTLPPSHQFAGATLILFEHLSTMDRIPDESWREWMDDETKLYHFQDAVITAGDLLSLCASEEKVQLKSVRQTHSLLDRVAQYCCRGRSNRARSRTTRAWDASLQQTRFYDLHKGREPVYSLARVAQTYADAMSDPLPVTVIPTKASTDDGTKALLGVYRIMENARVQAESYSEVTLKKEIEALDVMLKQLPEHLAEYKEKDPRGLMTTLVLKRAEFQAHLQDSVIKNSDWVLM